MVVNEIEWFKTTLHINKTDKIHLETFSWLLTKLFKLVTCQSLKAFKVENFFTFTCVTMIANTGNSAVEVILW